MSVVSLLRFITGHPLNKRNKVKAITRFARWQISTRLNPYPVIYSYTDRTKLIIQRSMTGATGNLYCGLHEFTDMGFLLHFLRKDDLFVDIGANIGSYTVLAGAHVGSSVVAIEPVPATFQHLKNNIAINQINSNVSACNFALGNQKGQISFTSTLDTMNHVATGSEANTIQVPVDTLDNILGKEKDPILLKIDVEGFETDVLNGADATLKKNQLKAIIIELNGSGAKYGYNEAHIHQKLLDHGYNPYRYDPLERKLSSIADFGTHNTIYIKDIDFVQDRVKKAEKVKILDSWI
ncbi:MAG: FkbM family methyltransferase [Chitinophagaceae bacterium]